MPWQWFLFGFIAAMPLFPLSGLIMVRSLRRRGWGPPSTVVDAVLAECDELTKLAKSNRDEAKRLDAEGRESLGRWAQGNAQSSASQRIRKAIDVASQGGA